MKKGFTLIELIIVIAIIGVLAMLATVGYKGYTKEANLTKHLTYIKELESASERYYMDNKTWPRLGEGEEYFTHDEIESYAKKIYDITGKTPVLDEDGKYYEINYKELSKYTKLPKDKANYILQNPVGSVIYLEEITKEGKGDLTNYEEPKITEPNIPEPKVEFSGLTPEAFDGDPATIAQVPGVVTWEGNMDNKKVRLNLYSGRLDNLEFQILDDKGQIMKFINLTDKSEITKLGGFNSIAYEIIKDIIVPEGAVKFKFSSHGQVRDIIISTEKHPVKIANIKSIPTDSKIELTWDSPDKDYKGVIIYRDGVFVDVAEGESYIDKPLYASTEYKYKIKAINTYGNASSGFIDYTAQTTNSKGIKFSGLIPGVFDGDSTTGTTLKGDVTWEGDLENKSIKVDMHLGRGYYIRIYNDMGVELPFINLTDNTEVPRYYGYATSGLRLTKEFLVPEGAKKIVISGEGTIYDITVAESLEHPESVSNIQSTATSSSITIAWENTSETYNRSIIYRNGEFYKLVEGKTHTDKPLYSDESNTYEIRALNIYGNASNTKTIHTEKTLKEPVVFRGLSAGLFDKDSATGTSVKGDITWEGDLDNKVIRVDMHVGRGYYIRMYNYAGEAIGFRNITESKDIAYYSGYATSGYRLTRDFLVPAGVQRINISGDGTTYDIYVVP